MNKHRYDDVIKFVASVIFGSSFRMFHEVVNTLINIDHGNVEKISSIYGFPIPKLLGTFPVSPFAISALTTAIFFAVFFRNVHGIIAYDIWADNTNYNPSFEQRPRHIVANFMFGLLGAILLPFTFIFMLSGHVVGGLNHNLPQPLAIDSTPKSPYLIGAFLFAPLAIYFIWNVFWGLKLKCCPAYHLAEYQRTFPPKSKLFAFFSRVRDRILKFSKACLNGLYFGTCLKNFLSPPKCVSKEEYYAYLEIVNFTALWLFVDLVFLVAFVIGFVLIRPKTVSDFCVLYINVAPVVLLIDYLLHVEFYFPTPRKASDFHEFGGVWNYILKDGIWFCHWGGKAASLDLIQSLDIQASDTVLEVCCGQGGTLNLLPEAHEISGIDKSQQMLDGAKKHIQNKKVKLFCADAYDLPFSKGKFSKIFSQDGDAWMNKNKKGLMSEISKVTAVNGIFAFQGYVRTASMSPEDLAKTNSLLEEIGYVNPDVPHIDAFKSLFEKAGFQVETMTSLHDVYLQDNLEMLKRFSENLQAMKRKFPENDIARIGRLLNLEKELFAKKAWTGVRIVARKVK
ncbi:MAG TPA: methyltransferase domain-containing protein [Verrucomicrobiae bacterium]|nr:methyltransferase domain-containing protein [Verrucomicrobiae bacterium]